MAERKSLAQENNVLAVDQKGRRPNDDIGFSAGLVIAGVTDLMASNAVTLAEDRLRVTARLPEELRHLCSLYDYLQEGPNGTTAVYDYLDGKKRKLLIQDIGSSLAEEGLGKACRCVDGSATATLCDGYDYFRRVMVCRMLPCASSMCRFSSSASTVTREYPSSELQNTVPSIGSTSRLSEPELFTT